MDLRIEGANRLERIGRMLKETPDKEIRKELYRAMNRTARPLREEAVAAALYVLPKRGGLAESVALRDFQVKVRPSGRIISTGIRSGRRHDIARWNRGILRHPVFADGSKTRREWAWINQRLPAGWLDTAMQRVAPSVRPEVIRALDEVARSLDAKMRRLG